MKVTNRRLRRNFQVFEKLEAGISLTGSEVKSVREGRINLDEAFVRIRAGEAWLYNANIPPYGPARGSQVGSTQPRKLLLHKREIASLEQKVKQKRLTIMPVACYTTSRKRGVQGSPRRGGSYTRGRKIKLEIALARGKKEYEKRQALKKKDIEREVEREVRGKG